MFQIFVKELLRFLTRVKKFDGIILEVYFSLLKKTNQSNVVAVEAMGCYMTRHDMTCFSLTYTAFLKGRFYTYPGDSSARQSETQCSIGLLDLVT